MADRSFDTYQTSFVGRREELRQLEDRLADSDRLVAIVGPPGTGKTRLAMQFADLCKRRGNCGTVWFIDLTDATDGAEVCANIAAELGCERTAGAIETALADAGPALVVLDNFEQVVAAGPETLGRWLPAATEARFLVTSRERLRIRGERTFELLPLSVPDDGAVDSARVLGSDAGRLFIDRAGDFELSDDDAPVVAQIIRRLDGIPLALELAATRLAVLGPVEILDRLSQRFELLSAGPRGAAARQATLEGAIDWSWTLLSREEQSTMLQCSVFRGGFPLEAAEAVVELGDKAPPVLDTLQSLTDKSLVRCIRGRGGAPTRFAFYESIREFARARLEQDRVRDAVVQRHVEYYRALGKRLGKPITGTRGPGFLERFATEVDNLASAYEVALHNPQFARLGVERALVATKAIETVMSGRPKIGTFAAFRDAGYDAARAAGLLDTPAADDPRLMRAGAYRFLGAVYSALGRADDGDKHYDRAIALAQELGKPVERARALLARGSLQPDPSRAPHSIALVEEALAIARKHGDDDMIAKSLTQLGNLRLFAGEPETAASAYEDARLRASGQDAALLLGNLAVALQEQGKFEEARQLLDEAVAAHREAGRRRLEGGALAYAAALRHERGDLDEAVEYYEKAVEILAEEEARRVEALALAGLASAHAMADRTSQARAALASAEARTRDIDDAGLWSALALHTANVRLAEARADNYPSIVQRAGAELEKSESALADARSRARELVEAATAGDARALSESNGAPLSDQWDDIRLAARLLARVLADDALFVAADASWFRAPGADNVDLSRRHVLRRLLKALAGHRQDNAGETLSLDELIDAGWPDERMDPTAAANRVHVALTTLRKLGLRDLLERNESGYRLIPTVPIARR